MTDEQTPYGFEWGPATIQRSTVINGIRILRVYTGSRHLEIAISPQGKSIRVALDGERMSKPTGRS